MHAIETSALYTRAQSAAARFFAEHDTRELRPEARPPLMDLPLADSPLTDLPLADLPLEIRSGLLESPIAASDGDAARASVDWTEQDIVLLHWGLLGELQRLGSPETALAEKLETLDWALQSDDNAPFSFASCVRVVSTSPLSPTPYFGRVSVEDLRDWVRDHARGWLQRTIERYPHWVQELIRAQPHWVARRLDDNPQWINEQIKAHAREAQPQLF